MQINSAKIWPYAIAGAITMVFGFCVATLITTSHAELDESNLYMQDYHATNQDINKIITQKIAFDKRYNISYINDGLKTDNTTIKYKITKKDNTPVNDAKIELIITRPSDVKEDIKLTNPKIENGIYSFEKITLPLKGRWNLMAKVNIDKMQRYYNIKADTRNKKISEY